MRVRYSFSSRRTGRIEGTNKHKTPVPKIVNEVIRTSDIILEVLDARFPNETRDIYLENTIKNEKKVLIYVLNKSDLIDIKEVKKKIELMNLYPYVFVSIIQRRGGRELRNRIKMEVKKLNLDIKARVGVIGYPNTGKSSLINLLIGRSNAPVSAQSGFTKGIKKIKLNKDILILDTPGVIPEKENSAVNTQDLKKHTLISVRTFDKVKDPDMIVASLMKKYPSVLESFYKIDANGDAEILLEELGRKKNLLKKGNQIDIDRTARLILKDWQKGALSKYILK